MFASNVLQYRLEEPNPRLSSSHFTYTAIRCYSLVADFIPRKGRCFGVAKPFARDFYDSKQWKQCRKAYISKRRAADGGMCEQCKERLGYMVHHKIQLTPDNINNTEISLNPELLEYVCKPCHDREEGHFIGPGPEKRFTFDRDGNPIPR